jgi:zinc protease
VWRFTLALTLPLGAGGAAASCASTHPAEAISLATSAGRVSVDSLTISYEVGGLRVIQRPSAANDVVAADLYFIGGVQEVTPATAGVEPLALRAAEFGSAAYPDTTSRFALAATGSRIIVDPEYDWTLFGLRGVVAEFDSTWAVFADRVMHPSLDETSIALVRSQLLREAQERDASPDGAVALLADSLAFAGHPYGLNPGGDARSLTALSASDVRAFVASQFVTSRMLLVIVGNVPRAQVERNVAATLARLPHGAYAWRPPPPAPVHPTSLATVSRSLSTNYLVGLFHGPTIMSPDYPAFEIATRMLSNQLNLDIRVDAGLSYAAYAQSTGEALTTGAIYVSTDVPDDVMPLVREALEHRRRTLEPQAFLDRFLEHYITEYLIANETNEAQAASLARAQIYMGDYREASRMLATLRRVDPGDVVRVARKYMHNIQFAYLGNRDRISPASWRGI